MKAQPFVYRLSFIVYPFRLSLLIVFSLISLNGYSQLRLGKVYIKSESETDLKNNSSFVKAYSNNLPVAVLNSFTTRFPKAENVTWYINNKSVSGYFQSDGEDITVNYKKDGLFLNARKTYGGSLLCQEAKDFLERETGFAHALQYVTEIVRQDEQIFEVSFTDEKRWHIYKFGRKNGEAFSLLEKTNFKKG